MSRITVEELDRLMAEGAPFAADYGFVVDEIGEGTAKVRLPRDDRHLRPGGTVGGPALMALADYAMYVATLSLVGPEPLAVTTSLSINFLRKPAPGDVVADVRVLKPGSRLVVSEVRLYGEGQDEPCAHVVGTYSVPPRGSAKR